MLFPYVFFYCRVNMKLFDFSFKNSRKLPLLPWCIWLFPSLHCVTGTLFPLSGNKKQLNLFFQGSSINQYMIKKENRQNPNSLPKKQMPVCCKKKKEKKEMMLKWNQRMAACGRARKNRVSRKEGNLPLQSQAKAQTHTHARTLLPQLDHRSQSQQCSLQPFYSNVLYVQMCATGEGVRPSKPWAPYDDRVSVTDMNACPAATQARKPPAETRGRKKSGK